jgi:hypothetical protein
VSEPAPLIATPHAAPRPREPVARRESAHTLLELQHVAGNRAVTRLIQRQAAPAPPKVAEHLHIDIGTDPDDAIVFVTQKGKLGSLTGYVTGRLSLIGTAAFDGETIPDKTSLPRDRSKQPSISLWAKNHARDLVTAALNATAPAGDAQTITLDVGGQPLTLGLNRGFEGLPDFGIAGEFHATPANLTFGTLKLTGLKARLDTTVWVTPGPVPASGPTASPADDTAIRSFAWAGDAVNFSDTTDRKRRTGAIASWAAVNRLEREINADVRDHPSIKNREQKVALLQEMRGYFGTDDRTVDHFKNLRKVNLQSAGKKSDLVMHDEAAARLEAVRDELAALPTPQSMPSTTVGWPRSAHSLGGHGNIGNLHNFGMAVDFNATEAPNLSSDRDTDLVRLMTGGVGMHVPEMWTRRQGNYDDMAKRTAERGQMADPDPTSAEGKFLDAATVAAQDEADRSEKFRHSLDVKDKSGAVVVDGMTEMARLKSSFLAARAGGSAWSDTDRTDFQKLIKPWTDTVDAELAKSGQAASAAGFKLTGLATGDALTKEKVALTSALTAAQQLRKAIKDDTPTDAQAKKLDELLLKLRQLEQTDPLTPGPADPAAKLTEFDTLTAAAVTRLAGYGKAVWYNRVADLRKGLDTPEFVLGTSKDLDVVNPAPAQLVRHGFFTLKDNSTNTSESFTIEFVRAMVKHGFLMLAAQDTPDSMHFELRWKGPGGH